MGEHNCQYIVDWTYNPLTEVFCDAPAPLKWDDGRWFCAEHFDAASLIRKTHEEVNSFWGCDFGMGDDNIGYYSYEFVIDPLDNE